MRLGRLSTRKVEFRSSVEKESCVWVVCGKRRLHLEKRGRLWVICWKGRLGLGRLFKKEIEFGSFAAKRVAFRSSVEKEGRVRVICRKGRLGLGKKGRTLVICRNVPSRYKSKAVWRFTRRYPSSIPMVARLSPSRPVASKWWSERRNGDLNWTLTHFHMLNRS